MNKKKNPRSKFIIIRVSGVEKDLLEKEARDSNIGFSRFIRERLNLNEDNN